MSMTVFELMATLGLNTNDYDRGLSEAENKAEGWGSKFGTIAKVGAAAMATTTAAVGAFGVSAVKTSMEFDSSMSQVMATMGYSVDELNTAGSEASETFNQLSEFAQEMGATTAFSASESAEALNYMALAGYDAETSMKMLPTVLDLAAAGGMGLADASDMVTDAQSALGLSLDETSEMVDKMAKASSKSNTSVAQLGDAFLTVGGTAKNLAGGTTELATMLGILADNGVKASEGGTALRNIILSLSAPTDQAASLMEELGLQVYDAQGNMRPLNDVFQDLNGILSSMTQGEQTQALSTMFNKVDLKSVNALLGTSAERFDELSTAIDNSAGSAKNMAEVQLDNLKGELTILGSAWEGLQIAVTQSVDVQEGSLRDLVHFASSSLSDITAAIKDGGLIAGFAELGNIGQNAFDAIIDRIRGLSQHIRENADQIIPAALETMKNFTNSLRENAGTLVDAGLEMLLSLAQGIANNIPAFIENLPDIVSNIVGIINDNLPKILETGLQIIVILGVGLIQAIPTLIANIPQIIKAMIDVFMAYNWLSFGAKIIGTIGSGIKSVASHIPDLMKEIGGTAKKKMASIDWIGLGKTVISTIVNGIRALISEIPNLLRSIGENGLNVFRNIDWAGLGRSVISFIASGIKALFYDIPNALINIGREGFNAFLNIDWFSIGTNIIQGIVNGLAYSAQAVYNTILNIASNALSAIMNFFGISSPSKVMRDKVGKMLAEGIGVGFGLGMPIDEMKGTLQDTVDAISDVDMSALDELGEDFIGISDFSSGNDFGDSIAIEKIDIEDDGKGRRYPVDNVTINVYAREGQDEKTIAEEVMKLFTLWDNQKKRVYA